MEDPQIKNYLKRIARAVEARRVGLIDDPPGRKVLYANVVKAPSGCLWYEYDRDQGQPIPVRQRAVRGHLTGILVYTKNSDRGSSEKVRVRLVAGLTQYEIETSLGATSGRMLTAGLLEAEAAIRAGDKITVGVRPATHDDAKDQVLFLDVYTDEGKCYPDQVPDELDEALEGVRAVRKMLGLSPDPYDNHIEMQPDHNQASTSNGDSSNGDDDHEDFPGEELYQGQGPPPSQKHREEQDQNGRPSPEELTPDNPLTDPDPHLVACATCGANVGEACAGDVEPEDKVYHDARKRLARGLAGNGQALITSIYPYLKQKEGEALRQVVRDVAQKAGRFEQDEWEFVRSELEEFHDDATAICNFFRDAPTG